MSPERAILLQSPGREPWVKSQSTYIEPQRGGTNPRQMLASKVPLLRSSYFFVYVFTQGSVRAFGTLATLGFAGVSCLRHSRQHHQPIRQQAQTTTPSQSDSKRKQRHQPTNTTTNANNDTAQPIRQQTQITIQNNKRKSLGYKSLGFERNCRPQ